MVEFITLYYPDGLNIITRVLKVEEGGRRKASTEEDASKEKVMVVKYYWKMEEGATAKKCKQPSRYQEGQILC